MSEITREALEGMGFVKDFEVYRFCYPYARDRGWIEVIIERKNVSVCANAEWNGFIEVPVATLPQLRRLIRSLFGDEALPRRELSSITDEECRQLFLLCHPRCISSDALLDLKIDRDGSEVLIDCDDDGVEICENTIYSYVCRVEGKGVPYTAIEFLINVCDFHLPAFHGERDE